MEQIKLWEIDDSDKITILPKSPLDYEDRLEKWLLTDISILSSNLAVIGSQVITPYGKKIDILAINSEGDLIIIELKRGLTYREVISQVLDYATWVKDITYDDINKILSQYGTDEYSSIDELFDKNFNKDFEEIGFNTDHKMLIVGSEIDDSTIRIVNYLSNEPYNVNINAVNFNYFKSNNGKEYLAQSFVLPESNLVLESKSKMKRRESIIPLLFERKKLVIGQKVYFQPAIDMGIEKENNKISATIVTTNQKCLQRIGDNMLYSFSGLRKIIIDELDIKSTDKNWGFYTTSEWVVEDGTRLVDLL
jgi:hypothetical protein